MTEHDEIGELYQHILDTLPAVAIAKRARMCRALSRIIGSANFAAQLVQEAEALEAIEKQHSQLALNFRQTGH